jgi:hypothetical protein
LITTPIAAIIAFAIARLPLPAAAMLLLLLPRLPPLPRALCMQALRHFIIFITFLHYGWFSHCLHIFILPQLSCIVIDGFLFIY